MKIDKILNTYDNGVDIPKSIERGLFKLFGANNVDDFSERTQEKIREANKMFYSGRVAEYSKLCKEYALYYLPVNMYKVWKPLIDLALKNQIKEDASILEFGCGPGSSTFGLIEFYRFLATENKERNFLLNLSLIEKENAFKDVFDVLFEEYQKAFPSNLKVKYKFYNNNVFEGLDFLRDKKFDIILESNVFNLNEGVFDEEIETIKSFVSLLNEHSSIIMIEPGKDEMLNSLRKIKNYFSNSKILNIFAPCCCKNSNCQQYAAAAVKTNNIELLQDLKKIDVKSKDSDYHYFEYLILRNDGLVSHTNNITNATQLNEIKDYLYQRVDIEANVLVAMVTDQCLMLKICDGSLLNKNKVELYIPIAILNKTNINRTEIDRGAKIRIKKVKVISFNMLECDEVSRIEIER